MTEKLYYGDSFLKEFTATVLTCEEGKNGFAITLATSGINLAVVRLISSAYGDTPDKNSYTSAGKIMKNAITFCL